MNASRQDDERIVAYLRENPGATAAQVCTALGLYDHQFTGVRLKRLTDEGRLTRHRNEGKGQRPYKYRVLEVPQAPVHAPPNKAREEQILKYLGEHPNATLNVLADLCGVGKFAISASLESLIKRGFVVKQPPQDPGNGAKRYSLIPPDPGPAE